MAAVVLQLCPQERVWLDPARIGILYAQLGGAEVQALLDRAMTEMELTRGELAAQYMSRDQDGFGRNLRRLRRIADHLGLSTLARVADDVEVCADIGDERALAATWARLLRTIDRAMIGAWESRI